MNVAARKETVYHLSPLRMWLTSGMVVIIPIFILALAFSDKPASAHTRNLTIYIGIFFFAFAAVMILILRYTRLALSADGIKLYQLGFKLETDWNNVAYLYDAPGGEGLVLHRPMECRGARLLSIFRNVEVEGVNLYGDEQIRFIAEHRFIPIEAFAYWLKKGQLRDDLIRHAPALNNG